jgi:hypothetical protein
MTAKKIMIIRHGEKPFVPDGPAQTMPFGLLENGVHSEYGLTVRGWQRLALWQSYSDRKERSLDPNSWRRRMSYSRAQLVHAAGAGGCN